jgi:hypothetical protein
LRLITVNLSGAEKSAPLLFDAGEKPAVSLSLAERRSYKIRRRDWGDIDDQG